MSRDILFVDGLCCGLGTSDAFIAALSRDLGDSYTIHRPSRERMKRGSTEEALNDIIDEFSHLQKHIVIGFSLGGLWAMLLACRGFTDRIVCLSPALPTNYLQIDPVRLRIFLGTLLTGRPFRFTEKVARKYLLQNVPDEVVRETVRHYIAEPASLIYEYARLSSYARLSEADVSHLRRRVDGLVITGLEDKICPAEKQRELAALLGFQHLPVNCGHTPQYGPEQIRLRSAICKFIAGADKVRLLPALDSRAAS